MKEIIKIEEKNKDGIKFLVCSEDISRKKIPIILLHQLLEDKESELKLAYYLAKDGYYVVVPDLLYHGESYESVRENRKFNFNKIFTEMDKSMELIKSLIDFLKEGNEDKLYLDNIGIVGSSYGGMLALTVGWMFRDIKFVAALCTSGNWKELIDRQSFEAFRLFSEQRPVVEADLVNKYVSKYDPIYNVEKFEDKPVLLINGALDTTFTYSLVQPFFDKMAEHYENIKCPQKLLWKRYSRTGHKVTWIMIDDLLKWLNNLQRK